MQTAELTQDQSDTGRFKFLANAIIASAGAIALEAPSGKEPKRLVYVAAPAHLLMSLRETVAGNDYEPLSAQQVLDLYLSGGDEEQRDHEQEQQQREQEQHPTHEPSELHAPNSIARLPGQFVKIGPFELRPTVGFELPFGRDYQEIPYASVSRLNGYVGLDEFSFYIREVPDSPGTGLRPSRNGIWVKQPHEAEFRRLNPGQAERVSPETSIRVGGNGVEAETGLPVEVVV